MQDHLLKFFVQVLNSKNREYLKGQECYLFKFKALVIIRFYRLISTASLFQEARLKIFKKISLFHPMFTLTLTKNSFFVSTTYLSSTNS